jgi:protein-S-isoprenylcysteine O-methyltransferase Ste14
MIDTARYAASHTLHFSDRDAVFTALRLVVFSACIVGGLFGYWYGAVAYLWGKRIRNVDFTLMGWLVNGVCYGPILGNVLWQMLPGTTGVDPVITAGPLFLIMLSTELFTNIVYTLTIWNLGTKFGLMTDKGMRTTGYYSVVRHPSYTIEGPVFVCIFMRGLSSPGQWLSAGVFILLYWIRSERDEQFMSHSNPDYEAYRQKVPYKFIPGLY